ncbi:hypothetical protein RRG08_003774 [Elysia crispata]|uniref:Uncharacterized protein n=1 Tax=Elysia crispata TaxID=231223 RepID=A0AAE1AVG7_9GAST|nr:hypothetical protein RRG08_003774 [Elysia crispata]
MYVKTCHKLEAQDEARVRQGATARAKFCILVTCSRVLLLELNPVSWLLGPGYRGAFIDQKHLIASHFVTLSLNVCVRDIFQNQYEPSPTTPPPPNLRKLLSSVWAVECGVALLQARDIMILRLGNCLDNQTFEKKITNRKYELSVID